MASESDEEFDEGVVVGQLPVVSVPRHIKKRSLKNKALSVSFDAKELREYVTGFHKRKMKRRKEAQKQLQEKERLKRIQARKLRKQEKEIALYGKVLSSEDPPSPGAAEPDDDGDSEQDNNNNMIASASETKMYEDHATTITVTTSSISHDDDDDDDDSRPTNIIPIATRKAEKSHGLTVKKKPLKKVAKHKSHKKGGKKHSFEKKHKKNKRHKR